MLQDFKTASKHFNAHFTALKKSLKPIGTFFVMGIGALLPFNLPKILMDHVSKITSFIFTNVPGLRQRLQFAGAQQTGIIVLVPCIGYMSNGLSFITTGDVVGSAIVCDDQAGMQHPEEFYEILNRKIKEAID